MRILHAIRSDGYSGVERYVERLATAQAADGHDVHVIGGDPARMRSALAEAGVGHIPAARTIDVVRELSRRRRAAQVVNTHMTAADLAAAVAFTGRSRPAVVSTRHFAAPRGHVGPLRLDRVVAATIDAELAISDAVAQAIGRPSTVVHSGLPERIHAMPPRERAVLIAQRLQPEKQTAVGVEAFLRSGLADAGWELWIAGVGPDRDRVEQTARSGGAASAVRLLGYRTDVPDLLARASLLLAPCPIEGLGLTVIEAMQAGLPVVAARGGGHVELLDGLDERALFAPEDADDAAQRLVSLAGDDTGREAFGAALRARQRAEYTLVAQATGTEKVYAAALRAREGAP
ncbi:glycosyltransferase family 4 protein [Microbacterium lacus]|uniref:Glycosyltransferase n=1 Tax=Microbacterium lacus TaxID=415217 RepID=A0ABP4S4F4_9MICO